jgi:hypothetical protein
MSRQDLTRRLAKLEAAHAPPSGRFDYRRPFHQIIADSDAEADAECQAVIADGPAQPGDNFIMHIATGTRGCLSMPRNLDSRLAKPDSPYADSSGVGK